MAQALHSHNFRDDRPRQRLKPRDTLVRAATVELLRRDFGRGEVETAEAVLQRTYSGCMATDAYLKKTASTPAMTTVATWAAELVATSVLDFMATEMPASAFAQLSARALTVTLQPGTGSIKVPSRQSPLTLAGAWVGEGNAKPVASTLLSSVTVTPFKLAAISLFSEEMLLSTAIEQLVRQALARDLTGLLDTSLLDSVAVSAIRPAGLFNGVTPITASAATPATAAATADLKALAAAVRTGHPDARVAFIMNPAQSLSLGFAQPQLPADVITSGYMPVNSVAAVDADAIAMLVGQPQFKLSRDAAVHAETVPLALGTGTQGSGVLAVPLSSMYQTDTVAIRSVLRTGWAKTRSGAAQIINTVIW